MSLCYDYSRCSFEILFFHKAPIQVLYVLYALFFIFERFYPNSTNLWSLQPQLRPFTFWKNLNIPRWIHQHFLAKIFCFSQSLQVYYFQDISQVLLELQKIKYFYRGFDWLIFCYCSLSCKIIQKFNHLFDHSEKCCSSHLCQYKEFLEPSAENSFQNFLSWSSGQSPFRTSQGFYDLSMFSMLIPLLFDFPHRNLDFRTIFQDLRHRQKIYSWRWNDFCKSLRQYLFSLKSRAIIVKEEMKRKSLSVLIWGPWIFQ